MSAINGHSTRSRVVLAAARPVMLLRYRPGVARQTARIVHVVPLPSGSEAGAVGIALCGALLRPDMVETVTPGHGVLCSRCVINHATTTPADTSATAPPTDAISSDTRPLAAAVCYRMWGWPVTQRGDQVWLDLQPDTVALIIPAPLAEQVTTILRQRRSPPLVLIHPDTPEHRVLLAEERYGVALPWPPGVHRTTGIFPLPPTMTPHGPIAWAQPPDGDALRLCREIDVFGALHTALRDPPS